MTALDVAVLALAIVGAGTIVWVLGRWLDAWLEKRRPTDAPDKSTVVGESHKPWM